MLEVAPGVAAHLAQPVEREVLRRPARQELFEVGVAHGPLEGAANGTHLLDARDPERHVQADERHGRGQGHREAQQHAQAAGVPSTGLGAPMRAARGRPDLFDDVADAAPHEGELFERNQGAGGLVDGRGRSVERVAQRGEAPNLTVDSHAHHDPDGGPYHEERIHQMDEPAPGRGGIGEAHGPTLTRARGGAPAVLPGRPAKPREVTGVWPRRVAGTSLCGSPVRQGP